MAQLIHMRQRIKAVETIKKITHAMRLISMSTHSRLRHKKVYLEKYREAFQHLWLRIKNAAKLSYNFHELPASASRHLVILVGSQKGLCGNFNSMLFKFFQQELSNPDDTHDFISIGKYAVDYLQAMGKSPVASYAEFNSLNFATIAHAITQIILNSSDVYSTVTLYSNYPKSFFIQKPRKTVLVPLQEIVLPDSTSEPSVEYIFEQSPQELSSVIKQLILIISIQELLFESLLAEQAARFLSMDSSTRNAENLLNDMKLEYNKTRQAAITRELTELASSY